MSPDKKNISFPFAIDQQFSVLAEATRQAVAAKNKAVRVRPSVPGAIHIPTALVKSTSSVILGLPRSARSRAAAAGPPVHLPTGPNHVGS